MYLCPVCNSWGECKWACRCISSVTVQCIRVVVKDDIGKAIIYVLLITSAKTRLLTEATRRRVQMWKMDARLTGCWEATYLGVMVVLNGELSALRHRGVLSGMHMEATSLGWKRANIVPWKNQQAYLQISKHYENTKNDLRFLVPVSNTSFLL